MRVNKGLDIVVISSGKSTAREGYLDQSSCATTVLKRSAHRIRVSPCLMFAAWPLKSIDLSRSGR